MGGVELHWAWKRWFSTATASFLSPRTCTGEHTMRPLRNSKCAAPPLHRSPWCGPRSFTTSSRIPSVAANPKCAGGLLSNKFLPFNLGLISPALHSSCASLSFIAGTFRDTGGLLLPFCPTLPPRRTSKPPSLTLSRYIHKGMCSNSDAYCFIIQ